MQILIWNRLTKSILEKTKYFKLILVRQEFVVRNGATRNGG
jgi:hypothetical protein